LDSDKKGPQFEVPTLIVKGGLTDGTVFSLSEGTSILVGSGRLANLQVPGNEIGSAHARIIWDDAGISILDNGSMGGTFVNGELVVTGPLADGDHIAFAPPGSKLKLPKILVRIPPGSVLITAPPAPPPDDRLTAPAPAEPAKRPPPSAPMTRATPVPRQPPKRRVRPAWERALESAVESVGRIDWRSPKILGPVGGVVLLLLGYLAFKLVLGFAPVLETVHPAEGEPGQVVALSGQRFAADAAGNTVRFGSAVAEVVAGNATGLTVTVPDVPDAASGQIVDVVVETRGGRSSRVPFTLTRTPKVGALDPEAALPGQTVTLRGQSLGGAVKVTVGGAAARVVEAKGDVIKFQVPNLPATPARTEPVVVTIGERVSKGIDLLIGKLPLVLEVAPARGAPGERVALRGRGFVADADGNKVTFSGAPALVLTASPTEVVVAAPALPSGQMEAEIVIAAGGRSTTNRAIFSYTHVSPAAFRPRFVPADAGTTRAQATVASQLGPLILLSSRGEAKSVQDRAVDVGMALNGAFDTNAAGFEARGESVHVTGRSEVLLRATPEDAAGYEAPPGVSFNNPAPTPGALAAHWAALLSDYAALFLHGQRPVRLLAASPRGRAFVDLQSELGWRPGVAITPGRAAALSTGLIGRLQEMAFGLGKESAATAGAALEGTWEGELLDLDGNRKPITVRIRQAAGKLGGSLTTGGRVAMEQSLQTVTARGGTVTFSVQSGVAVRFFVGRLDASGISGQVHSGNPTGPQAGSFTLKYAP
jgi:hypothetical protein